MSNVLYYPHYTPSDLQLRSLLCFFDNVGLIVPWIDQEEVRGRKHLLSLLEHDDKIVTFFDPEGGYGEWARNDEALKYLDGLVGRILKTAEGSKLSRITRAIPKSQPRFDDHRIQDLLAAGWKPVAAQKFPDDVLHIIESAGVGRRVGVYRNPKTGRVVEHDCILAAPQIADFILARLAREISTRRGMPTMTFSVANYEDHAFERYARDMRPRYDLLSVASQIAIPSKIVGLSPRDFFDVRAECSKLRRGITRYLQELVIENDLDSEIDRKEYCERIISIKNELRREIELAELSIVRQRTNEHTLFVLGLVATVAAGAAGAICAGPIGASLSAAGIFVAEGAARRMILGNAIDAGDGPRSFARLKGAIEKRERLTRS